LFFSVVRGLRVLKGGFVNARIKALSDVPGKNPRSGWIEKLCIRLLVLTVCAPLFFACASAQDKISEPGVYSGYSGMLYEEIVHKS